MPLSRRLLSLLLWSIHRMGLLPVLISAILAIVGLVRWARGAGIDGLPWWGLALLLLMAWAYVDSRGYMLFAADDSVGVMEGVRPGLHRALASGRLLNRHWSGLLTWAAISGEGVQVRWLDQRRPPCLAVIQPPEMPESTYSPLEEAERFACWYPGGEVEVGWVADAWAVYPGVRFRFIGKQLILALPSEGEARGLADTLTEKATYPLRG